MKFQNIKTTFVELGGKKASILAIINISWLYQHYRQASCDVLVLIFLHDGPNFWRQKIETVNGLRQQKKEKKKKEGKKNIVLSQNTSFFTVIAFRGKEFWI